MGFGFDAVTKVQSVERRPDGTLVELELWPGGPMPMQVKKVRARARAIIVVGAMDVAATTPREILNAIQNMSFGDIDRLTEVTSASGNMITVLVNTEP